MASPVYSFFDFEIVTARREISHNGEPLAVEPKVYDLLLYLLERRDRAVGKDELQDAIWPNVIVTESALTRCVMKARQAVDDDSRQMRVIGTVKKGGYRFVAPVREHRQESRVSARRTPGREQIPVAVLPFANVGDSAEQDFLADGLTLDISTDLSRNAWLFVISPGSLGNYRSLAVDYQQVVEEFGVQYVVEGSLRSAGENLRINASLVDATTGAREWSERYDGPLVNFFEIQDDITRQIVASLGSQVRKAEGRRSVKADPEALDVWGLLHKGTGSSWSRFNRESNLQAEAAYRAALKIEPDNGRALAFLATSLAMKISNGWSDNITADSFAAWSMGKRGVDALPEDPLVLASYGHIHTCLGEAAKGVEYLHRSLELDPNSAWSMGLLALALTCSGRAEDAIGQVSAALRLSPRDEATHWFLATLSWAYLQQEYYDDAAREAQRSVNAYPGWSPPWVTLAVTQAALGQPDDGRESIAACKRVDQRVTRAGFERYFDYVIKDGKHRQYIRGLLKEVWPG